MTFFATGARRIANSTSRPASGFCMQVMGSWCLSNRSQHPSLQAMHWRMSSSRPSRALLGSSGSHSVARVMITMSASWFLMISLAVTGSLIRMTVKTGMSTSCLISAAQ